MCDCVLSIVQNSHLIGPFQESRKENESMNSGKEPSNINGEEEGINSGDGPSISNDFSNDTRSTRENEVSLITNV